MIAIVGKRAAQRPQVGRPAARGGEELHHARSGRGRGQDLGRREDARHRLEPELERGLDHLRHEAGADDESGARRGCGTHLLRVDDGADADRPALSGGARHRVESAGCVNRHLDLLDPAADKRSHRPWDVAAFVEPHDSDQRAGAEHVRLEHRPTLPRAML